MTGGTHELQEPCREGCAKVRRGPWPGHSRRRSESVRGGRAFRVQPSRPRVAAPLDPVLELDRRHAFRLADGPSPRLRWPGRRNATTTTATTTNTTDRPPAGRGDRGRRRIPVRSRRTELTVCPGEGQVAPRPFSSSRFCYTRIRSCARTTEAVVRSCRTGPKQAPRILLAPNEGFTFTYPFLTS